MSNEPKQSKLSCRCDLLPPRALLAVGRVLKEGVEKYGTLDEASGVTSTEKNWRAIPVADHLNHVLTHLLELQTGNQSEDHLAHAATRLLFALELRETHREAKKEAENAQIALSEKQSIAKEH